jgi:hypothetical protein
MAILGHRKAIKKIFLILYIGKQSKYIHLPFFKKN